MARQPLCRLPPIHMAKSSFSNARPSRPGAKTGAGRPIPPLSRTRQLLRNRHLSSLRRNLVRLESPHLRPGAQAARGPLGQARAEVCVAGQAA